MSNVLEGDTVAQLAHFFAGLAICLVLDKFGVSWWKALLIMAAIAFAKEALEALGIAPWEPKQPWGSSMKDFAFFLVGGGSFLAVLLFEHIRLYFKTHC